VVIDGKQNAWDIDEDTLCVCVDDGQWRPRRTPEGVWSHAKYRRLAAGYWRLGERVVAVAVVWALV
jgi:hypothetical protein